MEPKNLKKTAKEVETICDKLGLPIDPKIKDLVIGLKRWGIRTTASCEGHKKRGLSYPWVDINPDDIKKAAEILQHWWKGKEKGHPAPGQARWVIKAFAGIIRLVPENKGARALEEMQEDAIAFGKWLQTIGNGFFK